jgi:cyclic pyranopterin phosphate synthase
MIAPKPGKILAISTSANKGTIKTNVASAELIADWGIRGDAHAGQGDRQVSLLAFESFAIVRELGADVHPGSFAENITTEGLDLQHIKIGDEIRIGDSVLSVTQIGKECHNGCEIKQLTGDCIMPREGIFARVVEGGFIWLGDPIILISSSVV